MAKIDETFVPKLWTQEILKEYVKVANKWPPRPKRDAATQKLRDMALGRPEFPEDPWEDETVSELMNIHRYMQDAAKQAALDVDRYILSNIKDVD